MIVYYLKSWYNILFCDDNWGSQLYIKGVMGWFLMHVWGSLLVYIKGFMGWFVIIFEVPNCKLKGLWADL